MKKISLLLLASIFGSMFTLMAEHSPSFISEAHAASSKRCITASGNVNEIDAAASKIATQGYQIVGFVYEPDLYTVLGCK